MRGRIEAVLAITIALLAGCDDRPTTWKAYVYRDVEDMEKVHARDGWATFEECQEFATGSLDALTEQGLIGPSGGDYVCGYRCGFKPEYGIEVCKEKRK